ncbi:MAG: CpsD/CapB family tyrosine-protein kinase [Planctomycetota bacterium]
MGRIDDALKKAQAERARKRGAPEPASVPTPPPAATPEPRVEREARPEPTQTRTVRAPQIDPGVVEAPAKSKGGGSILKGMRKVGPAVDLAPPELLVVARDPSDPRSEQFRSIKTNLHALDPEPRVIGFTSAIDEEGTSAVATNLACVFAEERHSEILVVDANLRERSAATLLGVAADAPGLAEILEGTATPDEVVVRTSIPHVSCIPPGRSSKNPGGLLSSPRLKEALEHWAQRFDRLLVDTPPTLNFTDAAVIGHHLDGVVLVVKLSETPRNLVEEALEHLRGARLDLFGCVLTNAAEPEPFPGDDEA